MDTTPSSTSFQVLDDAVSVAEPIDVDTEPDDEVDQLESDSDHDDPDGRTAGSSSKKSGPKCDVRIPGNTFLPAERLESIIQADGGVGSLGLSKEGLFVLSIATEELIKRLAQCGLRHASTETRTTLAYGDTASAVQQYQELQFLKDTIPPSLSLADALKLRETREKELFEQDPALGGAGSTSNAARNKVQYRPVANGKDRANGHASASYASTSSYTYPGKKGGESSLDVRSWTTWSDSALQARVENNRRAYPSSAHNGRSSYVPPSHPGPYPVIPSIPVGGVSNGLSVEAAKPDSSTLPAILHNADASVTPSASSTKRRRADDAEEVNGDPSSRPLIAALLPLPSHPTASTSTSTTTVFSPLPSENPFESPGRTIYSQQPRAQS